MAASIDLPRPSIFSNMQRAVMALKAIANQHGSSLIQISQSTRISDNFGPSLNARKMCIADTGTKIQGCIEQL